MSATCDICGMEYEGNSDDETTGICTNCFVLEDDDLDDDLAYYYDY